MILYGSAVLEREDAASIVSLLKRLNAKTKVCGRSREYFRDKTVQSNP